MRKNTQTIACFILVPMLIFTFVVTVRSDNRSIIDDSQKIIYQYFNYRNNKDLKSIEKLLLNKEDINVIKAENNALKSIKLISLKEEKNESIKKAYLKNNISVSEKNIKIYKVRYEIVYDSSSSLSIESGTYDCWYFLTRASSQSNWKIDIGEI